MRVEAAARDQEVDAVRALFGPVKPMGCPVGVMVCLPLLESDRLTWCWHSGEVLVVRSADCITRARNVAMVLRLLRV